MNEKTSQTDQEPPIKIRKANECIADVKHSGPPEMLFDEFWREGELALLFGGSCSGKSILAVQVAEGLARGSGIDGFRMSGRRRKALYVDMDMSDAQFGLRNSIEAADSSRMKTHRFSENFYHDRPPSADELIVWLRKAIAEIGFRVVVLDSLSAFKKTQDGVRETLKLMRELRALKDELNISILVIADCPEQKRGKTLTEADLGRSRVLCTAADSAFAICRHPTHFDQRYIVQTRSKNAPIVWNEKNAPLCSIIKQDTVLLAFRFDDRFIGKLTDEELELICNIKQARDEYGETYRDIAEIFEISRARVERLYKKRSPAIEKKYRAMVVASPVDEIDEVRNADCGVRNEDKVATNEHQIRRNEFDEPEEWDEAEFEKPVRIEKEEEEKRKRGEGEMNAVVTAAGAASSLAPDRLNNSENAETTNEHEITRNDPKNTNPQSMDGVPQSGGLPKNGSQNLTANFERRTIYDLPTGVDGYGREIFIESQDGYTGKPTVWYQFDKKGILFRSERKGAGIIRERVTNPGLCNP